MTTDKVGLQTIIFGRRIDDLTRVIKLIRSAGYRGVEFSQAPSMIREYLSDSEEPVPVSYIRLLDLLKDNEITLLGLSGGSLEERIAYCSNQQSAITPLYLYTETCNRDILRDAASNRLRLAVHPHAFMPNHQIKEALEQLRDLRLSRVDCPKLMPAELETYGRPYWLPDSAHIYITGQNVEDAIKSVNVDQIIAVHIKDWDAAYGRSYHRYARGFTELGQGHVRPERTVELLRQKGYNGWIVVEQDYSRQSPQKSIYDNAMWLQRNGLKTELDPLVSYLRNEEPNRYSPAIEEWPTVDLGRSFLGIIGDDLDSAYQRIANAFASFPGCKLATVWSYGRSRPQMGLLAASGNENLPKRIDKFHPLNSSIDDVRPIRSPLPPRGSSIGPEGYDSLLDVARSLGATMLVGLPIPNRFNPHHVRLFIAAFIDDTCYPLLIDEDKLDRAFEATASELASCLDSVLDERCEYAAARVNVYAAGHHALKAFLKEMVAQIAMEVRCQGVTVFRLNQSGNRLHRPESTGFKWISESEAYYEITDGTFISDVWQRKEPLLAEDVVTRNTQGYKSKSYETDGVDDQRCDLLGVPLLTPDGHVVGVVRCRNKQTDAPYQGASGEEPTTARTVQAFTDDDAAIVDAISRAVIPHFTLLMNDVRRAEAAERLTHELNTPIAMLRHIVDSVGDGLDNVPAANAHDLRTKRANMLRLTELITSLIANIDMMGGRDRPIHLTPVPTNLRDEIVMPAVRYAEALLIKRSFDVRLITCHYFDGVPKLHIDQTLFLQVFFNLLANSIKFAYKDPKLFRVEIVGRRDGDVFKIDFSDYGPGIDDEQGENIFGEQLRGPAFMNKLVSGRGLGLWIVRRITHAHEGDITLTHNYSPTTFTLTLPQRLESGPPKELVVGVDE